MRPVKKFEEYNNVELQGGGLQCDNPNCDYEDMTIPMSDYEKYINKPCPKCGENLLTQEDYDETVQMLDAISMVNSFSAEDLNKIVGNLSQEEIDKALDMMNQLKMKKTEETEDGAEIWTINPRSKGQD